jgi:hypothetical protein
MLKLIVSKNESGLLETMRSIGYGEMFSVEVPDALYTVPQELSTSEADLIEFIRSGHPHIDVLRIHAKEPTCAEVDFKENGFSCRKKYKFPATH